WMGFSRADSLAIPHGGQAIGERGGRWFRFSAILCEALGFSSAVNRGDTSHNRSGTRRLSQRAQRKSKFRALLRAVRTAAALLILVVSVAGVVGSFNLDFQRPLRDCQKYAEPNIHALNGISRNLGAIKIEHRQCCKRAGKLVRSGSDRIV